LREEKPYHKNFDEEEVIASQVVVIVAVLVRF